MTEDHFRDPETGQFVSEEDAPEASQLPTEEESAEEPAGVEPEESEEEDFADQDRPPAKGKTKDDA